METAMYPRNDERPRIRRPSVSARPDGLAAPKRTGAEETATRESRAQPQRRKAVISDG